MTEKKSYKICLVGNSLSRGGAEKAHTVLSDVFQNAGLEVYNVIFENQIDYQYSGTLFCLNQKQGSGYFDKLKMFVRLYRYIKKNKFDYIIDFRYRGMYYTEYLLVTYIFGQAKYIPSIRSYHTGLYFTSHTRVSKKIYKNAYAIVTVSKGIEKKVKEKYAYQNVTTIYNLLEIDKIGHLSKEKTSENLDFEYIIAVGRMNLENVKQQDVIIEAYSHSELIRKNIKLLLLGDGENKPNLKKLVLRKKLKDKVIFVDFKSNPYPYIKNAAFLVLASKYEGFPNVILESFACQTPVVSYDCKSGPGEIITDRENGLLVKNQNVEELIKAMNMMSQDKELYELCKSNTLKTAQKFSSEIIGKQWLDLMNIKL